MHSNSILALTRNARIKHANDPIVEALCLTLEELAKVTASYKRNIGCKACREAYSKDQQYMSEWHAKAKARKRKP